ncbi:MAG: P-type conjugative transfer ATPase TrbB [Firmicutes bacterium]|nr:P-type conjugative transfer ATPase TrbB [Bacillota bacterium]
MLSKDEESFNRSLELLQYAMGSMLDYMQDENIFELIVNPDGKLWIDTFGKGKIYTGIDITPDKAKQIIYAVAAISKQVITENFPLLEAEVPNTKTFDSFRFQGLLPGVVTGPALNIRKHPKKILTLDNYVEQGVITERQKAVLVQAIRDKKNIIAAGATASGKTTFLNALLAEIAKLSDRVVMIEDTKELHCTAEDCVAIRTFRSVNMIEALRATLRMSPNRIVVGEIRGEEALTLLDAWSTGHGGGCSTVHSNSAYDTLLRLENLTSRVAKNPQQVTISRAVDMVAYLRYSGLKRTLEEIICVKGYDANANAYITEKVI